MTTKVTVDAHAGWDVKVTPIDGAVENMLPTIVSAGTVQDFHVWDGRALRIEEVKRA